MSFREEKQKEALSKGKCGGTIAMPPRVGKTKVGLDICSKYSNPLVAYPKKPIFQSWIKDSEKFGIDMNHVKFSTFKSLNKLTLSDYDCLILDEVQEFSENMWSDLISQPYPTLIALTGTLPRPGSTKRMYIDRFCPVVYELSLDETTGVTNKDYHITVHLVPMSTKKDIPLTKGGMWSERDKIKYYERKNDNFQMMLRLIHTIAYSETKWKKLQELVKGSKRCLIFVESIKQADSLGLPTYHSKNKLSEQNLEDFNSGKINKLVTINQLNAGITFENLDHAILLHAYASSDRAHQRISRALNFIENVKAKLDVVCLSDSIDVTWARNGLSAFAQHKISWK